MKTVIIQVNDAKGRHRSKVFNVDPDPNSKSMGYMVGYIQACQDNGYNVTMIDEGV